MNVSQASIAQNSNSMFQIINKAQTQENEIVEKMTVMALAEQLDADASLGAETVLGSNIDILV